MCKYLLAFIFCLGCSSSSQEKELLDKAASVHNDIVNEMSGLKADLNRLEVDALYVTKDSLKEILKSIDEWQRDLVEVQGNEHHDPQKDDHHHDHSVLEVTAEEMLNIQLEMQKRSDAIKTRFDSLQKCNKQPTI